MKGITILMIIGGLLIAGCYKDNPYLRDFIGYEIHFTVPKGQDKTSDKKIQDTIKVKFNNQPTAKEVKAEVDKALDEAIKSAEKDPVLKRALQDRKKSFDEAYAESVANDLSHFDALTLTYFWVGFYRDQIVVVYIPIQLIKGMINDLVSAHEDAHVQIGKWIIEQLADKIIDMQKKEGKTGSELWTGVRQKLEELDREAQKCFDEGVDHENLTGTEEEQMEKAMKAFEKVKKKVCPDVGEDPGEGPPGDIEH